MKKYNLSQIMKDAWSFYRAGGRTFSKSLKAAWACAKVLAHRVIVKSWFLNKEFTSGERYAISVADAAKIERETEKAILVKWFSEFGTIKHWVPKSCCENF